MSEALILLQSKIGVYLTIRKAEHWKEVDDYQSQDKNKGSANSFMNEQSLPNLKKLKIWL